MCKALGEETAPPPAAAAQAETARVLPPSILKSSCCEKWRREIYGAGGSRRLRGVQRAAELAERAERELRQRAHGEHPLGREHRPTASRSECKRWPARQRLRGHRSCSMAEEQMAEEQMAEGPAEEPEAEAPRRSARAKAPLKGLRRSERER